MTIRKWSLLVAAMLASGIAAAQTFPSKTVRLISGVTPGSASDTMARIVAEKLTASLGQSVIVEDGGHNANNRPYRYRSRTADWLAGQLGLPRI